jgi:hypothetical protein
LLIEAYFQQIRQTIDACRAVQSSAVTYDKRGTHEGYIRGELHFEDRSILHLREFVDVETTVERLTYVYQYMDTATQFVFRYDNTGHQQRLGLPTYPHHKHEGHENNVVASPAPDLRAVLDEIEGFVQLP